ncbi:MAG: hypothetical protein JWR69_3903 [Pedosphaera sp.]|nr:hypothetical protein [Pedosphaera sp.]
MTPAAGDSAVEQQVPLCVIKKDITGGFRTKQARLLTIAICFHGNAWNGRRALPQTGLGPAGRRFTGLKEQHLSGDLAMRASEEAVQFFDAGPRAGTLGMGEHDQGGAVMIQRYPGSRRPVLRGDADVPAGILVVQNDGETCSGCKQPGCAKGNSEWKDF